MEVVHLYAGPPISRRRPDRQRDVVVIQINPSERKGTPRTPMEIQNRMNEISFNSSLLRESRSSDFGDRLIRQGRLSTDKYRPVRVHIIENQNEINQLGASSKLNAEWDFLCHLRDLGRRTAAQWLEAILDSVGERSSVDLRAMFKVIGPEHQG